MPCNDIKEDDDKIRAGEEALSLSRTLIQRQCLPRGVPPLVETEEASEDKDRR